MDAIPSSVIAAVASSAAAGKNPWMPLALIFLLAAPESVPGVLMHEDLHRELHALGPGALLWSLGAVFGVLAIADSLADKIGFIEKWLVPVSTAWRPFAGIACAAIVGVAAAGTTRVPEPPSEIVTADAGLWVGGSVVALTLVLGSLTTWIATMGKTGARLVLLMVPVPGLKLAHSIVDDLFAFGATIAGFAVGDHALVVGLVLAYLAVGVFSGPILTRLTWIHVRIGWRLLRKAFRASDAEPIERPPPAWLAKWLTQNELRSASLLEAYAYRAPKLGLCRAGYLVVHDGGVAFVSRVRFAARAWQIDAAALARVGLSESSTERTVAIVERTPSGALRQAHMHLFPQHASEVDRALDEAARRGGWVRVKPTSETARRALPGYADRERSVRFGPARDAGSLRLQGLLTIAAAIISGLLTGGVFVLIGAGYLASPYKRRFLVGLLISGYLSLCVLGSFGLGWPAAVLYACVLNAVVLRDHTRCALKAYVEGFYDRRAWLPVVAARVWVHAGSLLGGGDRHDPEAVDPASDGTWRTVVALLKDPPDDEVDPALGDAPPEPS
ncbi:MAG: hypothetical protein AB7S26_21290 [Sandaracinaceae bacterium]